MVIRKDAKELEVVVWGATGFTGRLVAEHLLQTYGVGAQLRWAIAGRSQRKLEQLRESLGPDTADLTLITADSHDRATLDAMVNRTAVVASAVGPYARHGSELVAACAESGTDYCDITGEVQWVRRMIDAHEETARRTGARLVHCCGFDSIPSDLGCMFTQQEMQRQHGESCDDVKLGVRRMSGSLSGGTYASMLNALDEARTDGEVRRLALNPYGLNPAGEARGPDGADQTGVHWDPELRSWTAPFVMAAVNTRVVRRSNALLDYAYGQDFRYNESMMTGRGASGLARAIATTAGLGGFMAAVSTGPTRSLLKRLFLPQPGEGPSAEARERGSFDIIFVGRSDKHLVRTLVRADRDPGYGATSRMLGESAVCLAKDAPQTTGGSWTPASSMGAQLLSRLEARAGMSFESV